jgi:hypothetical protein
VRHISCFVVMLNVIKRGVMMGVMMGIMMGSIVQSFILLFVIRLCIVMLSFMMLGVVMLRLVTSLLIVNDILMNVVIPSVIMLKIVILNIIMLRFIVLIVIRLIDVLTKVVAPFQNLDNAFNRFFDRERNNLNLQPHQLKTNHKMILNHFANQLKSPTGHFVIGHFVRLPFCYLANRSF